MKQKNLIKKYDKQVTMYEKIGKIQTWLQGEGKS